MIAFTAENAVPTGPSRDQAASAEFRDHSTRCVLCPVDAHVGIDEHSKAVAHGVPPKPAVDKYPFQPEVAKPVVG